MPRGQGLPGMCCCVHLASLTQEPMGNSDPEVHCGHGGYEAGHRQCLDSTPGLGPGTGHHSLARPSVWTALLGSAQGLDITPWLGPVSGQHSWARPRVWTPLLGSAQCLDTTPWLRASPQDGDEIGGEYSRHAGVLRTPGLGPGTGNDDNTYTILYTLPLEELDEVEPTGLQECTIPVVGFDYANLRSVHEYARKQLAIFAPSNQILLSFDLAPRELRPRHNSTS